MIRHYLTLEDFIKSRSYNGEWPQLLEDGVAFMQGPKNFLEYIFTESSSVFPNKAPVKQDISNNLFCNLICPAYKETYIGYVDCELTDEAKEAAFKKFRRNFLYVLNNSYEVYSKLIGIYESEKDKLMDDIKSETESKYNDTPQNVQGIYDWDTDDHLTSVTRNTSSTQIASKIARIAEIDRLLKDYYDEWAKQFGGLFIYE